MTNNNQKSVIVGNARHSTGFGGMRRNGVPRLSMPVQSYTNRFGNKALAADVTRAREILEDFFGRWDNNTRTHILPKFRNSNITKNKMKSIIQYENFTTIKIVLSFLKHEINLRLQYPHGPGGNHFLIRKIKLYKHLYNAFEDQRGGVQNLKNFYTQLRELNKHKFDYL